VLDYSFYIGSASKISSFLISI